MGHASRREFSVADMVAIVNRATDADGKIHCERCGAWLKSRHDWEIDHVLAEGIRPDADRKRKLRPADGQLLCVAVCHKDKTRDDVGSIAQAKRREARGLGLERPGKGKLPAKEKPARKPLKVAVGLPGIARRFGLKRLALVLAVLGLAAPAEAHCFSIWHYLHPQHCRVRLPVVALGKPRLAPARTATALPQSAPVAEPVSSEEALRARAIDSLKVQLGERQ